MFHVDLWGPAGRPRSTGHFPGWRAGPALLAVGLLTLACGSADTPTGGADAGGGDAKAPVNIDLQGITWTCVDPAWKAAACAPPIWKDPPVVPADHVDPPTAVTYADNPPSSGPHRSVWAKWGAYTFLPPQRWVHNLEHGAMALLYHPCAPQSVVDDLKHWAQAVAADGGGAFRWVLSPYPDLPATVALVTWGHVMLADCWTPTGADEFRAKTYRTAPEDEDAQGGYQEMWLGL